MQESARAFAKTDAAATLADTIVGIAQEHD